MFARELRSRNFLSVTAADFLARTAYQMGKAPLLPIFAASLGATDLLLGLIVSVSTVTGMVLKPLVGALSDRWGRRSWLLVGTAFFAFMPFVYRTITSPEQLFYVRIIHGMATAIYGPVTLAYVTEQAGARRAQGLGWFGLARSGGYIVGPMLAGFLLLVLEPVQVYTVIGLMGCATFVPILFLDDRRLTTEPIARRRREGLVALAGLRAGVSTGALWLAGGLEALTYVALYAMKAFLPIYALSIGINVALVGSFFAVQEAIVALAKPVAGQIGDRIGYRLAIGSGMVVIGLALPLLAAGASATHLMVLALFLGLGQALIFPSTTALVSVQIGGPYTGAGMGLLGTLQNGGKVVGPLLGGLLVAELGYGAMFALLGACLLFGAFVVTFTGRTGLAGEHVSQL